MSAARSRRITSSSFCSLKRLASEVNRDIDRDEGEDTAPPLVKMLIGFTNTMLPDAPKPSIKTSFIDHKTDLPSDEDDLISPSEFFTPREFEMADHRVHGRFDGSGAFRGDIYVYGNQIEEHVVPFQGTAKETRCGPFKFDLAYVQGSQKDSSLEPEAFASISKKLSKVGGMYIYRNGIRVLPYGNSDFDFLDIERRRTLSAGRYFFSHRRMFGVISLNDLDNPNLREKAGREGFQENLAYRQLRDILKNFFVQLAADFFRETSPSEVWRLGREEQQRRETVRKQRLQETRKKLNDFRSALEKAFKALDANEPKRKVESLLSGLEAELSSSEANLFSELESERFIRAERKARQELSRIRNLYSVTAPEGVGLTQDLRRDWDAYRKAFEVLDGSVFEEAAVAISETVSRAAQREKVTVNLRERVRSVLGDRLLEYRTRLDSLTNEADRGMEEARREFSSAKVKSLEPASRAVASIEKMVDELDDSGLGEESVEMIQRRLDTDVDKRVAEAEGELRALIGQVSAITRTFSIVDTGVIEEAAALEEELLALQDQIDTNLELAQLGMAVQVINHEFRAAIRTIRRRLRDLKAWADVNPDIRQLYTDLRTSFDHLDGYLTLFTPLDRRLYRTTVDIEGAEISKFLRDLFDERLKAGKVTLKATEVFRRHIIHGYPSTFYPVFINLVDNSLFWLEGLRGERRITLDADCDALLVGDNGPGIPERDLPYIFERGFTRKPGGRGMGLYISKSVLSSAGYELTAVSRDDGALFQIRPKENSDGEMD